MDGTATILDSRAPASTPAVARPDYARRIDDLAKVIANYSEITDRLQHTHEQLNSTVHRLRAELSEKNRLLERRNRLAALGEMAAGMAHEIRNPLGGIQLYASLLAKDVSDRKDSLELVTKISKGVKHLNALVGQVLQFTRELNVQPAPVDLPGVIQQALEYAAPALQERRVQCTLNVPSAMAAKVDPLYFGQAVLNLILNAAEAIGADGKILITCTTPPPGAEAKQFHLSIVDSGPGIPPSVLDRIFNPFFTTKDTGTGLGLAIVHRVIEAHDGTIVAATEPAGGARFEIRI